MRIVIDVPDKVAMRALQAVESGAYPSVDALTAAAIAQLLETSADASAPRTPPESAAAIGARPSGRYTVDARPDAAWLWGMVNRVLPLKLAARIGSELASRGPIQMHAFHAAFAERGLAVGRRLKSADVSAGRMRNESLSTGFPLGDDEQKAKVRFAHQFLGRRSSAGDFVGGAFELGLIGPVDSTGDWVAPTPMGWEFALLPNPVLDGGAFNAETLSRDEREYYLFQITAHVPAERNALLAVLSALSAGAVDVSTMSTRLRPYQDANLTASVQDTSRSGALARFTDVGAIRRIPNGRSAYYEVLPLGLEAWDRLKRGSDRNQ